MMAMENVMIIFDTRRYWSEYRSLTDILAIRLIMKGNKKTQTLPISTKNNLSLIHI